MMSYLMDNRHFSKISQIISRIGQMGCGVFQMKLSQQILSLCVPSARFLSINHYFYKKTPEILKEFLFGTGKLIWAAINKTLSHPASLLTT